MRLLLAWVLLSLLTTCAQAQPLPDIFQEPPREAFGLGLVLAYEHKIVTVIQDEAAIREACGVAFACLTQMEDGTCQIRVWTGLPDNLERMAIRNLVARCGGWVPVGE